VLTKWLRDDGSRWDELGDVAYYWARLCGAPRIAPSMMLLAGAERTSRCVSEVVEAKVRNHPFLDGPSSGPAKVVEVSTLGSLGP
jgi:hypothetical protein